MSQLSGGGNGLDFTWGRQWLCSSVPCPVLSPRRGRGSTPAEKWVSGHQGSVMEADRGQHPGWAGAAVGGQGGGGGRGNAQCGAARGQLGVLQQ